MSMTTTYTGVRIADMPDLGAVNDASSVVGERAGSGRFAATALRSYLNTYVAPGSGAVTRTITSKLAELVSVKDFGAIGDNVADDTAAFQAGLAYVASQGGGRLYIPCGTYKITGPLTYSVGFLHLTGDGKGSTLQWGNPSAVLFSFSGPDITLSDFRVVTPFKSCTAGGLFYFLNANNAKLSRVWTDGGFNVVQFMGASSTPTYRPTITDCNFVNVMSNGVFYDQYFGGIGIITGTEMLGAPNNGGCGILIEAGDTFNFTNMNVAAFTFGVLANSKPGGIGYVANIFATNVLCDGAGAASEATLNDAWCFLGGTGIDGTYVTRVHLSSCWGGYMGRHGFNIENATDVTLVNCIAIANQGHGFRIDSPSQFVTIDACTATWNSLNNPNDNDGIRVEAGVTDFSIIGCRSRPSGANVVNTQRSGISLAAGASDRYIMVNNQLSGNLTVALSDGGTGTNKIVTPNITA